ncbi:hypothetical protein GCM10007426_43100 [Alloalcanivorax dieselolei]|nr:hypothetical protein GCM10007426_43100 [Alloalcanivorax dieselolei]
MLAKNSELNFNDDLMLIDKQGVVLRCGSLDRIGQHNRFRRVEALFEYAMCLSTFIESEVNGLTSMESTGSSEWRDAHLRLVERDVVPKSVSARRAWQLISSELQLANLEDGGVPEGLELYPDLTASKKHWYERPLGLIFIGVSVVILSTVLVSVLGLG